MPTSCPTPFGNEAAELLVASPSRGNLLDIGPGQGVHSEFFSRAGFSVDSVGLSSRSSYEPDVIGEYETWETPWNYHFIWASHVLEHSRNSGAFLDKCWRDLSPQGTLAVTVPPPKINLVGGHVSLWTPGQLLYHLVLAGFNCRQAKMKCYGYNISVIVRKAGARLKHPTLIADAGDIETLATFFPFPVWQDMPTFPREVNWTV